MTGNNPDEKTAHHHEQDALHHFFKEIARRLTNADEVHVTGTGTAQEQFIHFLAGTPPFKNTATTEDTSNKMSDEGLVGFIDRRFN
jgi:stalled ribosome rescue protein Dom34